MQLDRSSARPDFASEPPCAGVPGAEHARWFAEKIQPHEPKLRAWLRGRFPRLCDIDDLIQETYLRIFRAKKLNSLEHPQSYLYATARNAAIDQLRRRRIVPIHPVEDLGSLTVLEESSDTANRLDHDQELEILAEAIEALPKRCRLVVKLRKLHGLSYKEIARKLGISPNTVNAQLAVGLGRCRSYFHDRGLE